jgi:hypothetical protein
MAPVRPARAAARVPGPRARWTCPLRCLRGALRSGRVQAAAVTWPLPLLSFWATVPAGTPLATCASAQPALESCGDARSSRAGLETPPGELSSRTGTRQLLPGPVRDSWAAMVHALHLSVMPAHRRSRRVPGSRTTAGLQRGAPAAAQSPPPSAPRPPRRAGPTHPWVERAPPARRSVRT